MDLINKSDEIINSFTCGFKRRQCVPWMSEDALQAFPKKLRERDIFNSDEYRALANKCNRMMSDLWNTTLYKNDKGLHAPVCWYKFELDDSDWKQSIFFLQIGQSMEVIY